MLNWLKNLIATDQRYASLESEAAVDAPDEVAGLNFRSAIEVHLRWKKRLAAVIDGSSSEQLNATEVCSDRHCTLGRWIYGPGQEQYSTLPLFEELKESHQRFHGHAGQVLESAQSGDLESAKQLMEGGGYVDESLNVSRLLLRMWRTISASSHQKQ